MDNGWIKLHRRFLDWEWYDKPEMVHFFIYLLLDANHADRSWRGITIKRGQLVTSLGNLSAKTHLSLQRVRTCLNRLKSTHEITSQSTSEYTIITICNYDSYQQKDIETNKAINKPANKRTTNQQQTINKPSTTNKNVKNDKNVKNNKRVVEKLEIDDKWKGVVFDWLEYKRERKESYKSERSVKAFVTRLRNLSGEDVAVAKKITKRSMAQNWAGIFEMKGGENEKDRRDSETARREQQIIELAREAGMAE